MKISERYSEYHDHTDGMCITQHLRNINGKKFSFTRVATKNRSNIIISEVYEEHVRRHTLYAERV